MYKRQGYKEASDEQNLDVLPELVFSARTIEDLKKELERFSPTALIVKDDLIALRLIQWLNNQGFRVPEDYAIISFNNSTFAEIMHPFLTTFDINIQELGKKSVLRLLALLKDAKSKSEKVTIPFKLIERESVTNR